MGPRAPKRKNPEKPKKPRKTKSTDEIWREAAERDDAFIGRHMGKISSKRSRSAIKAKADEQRAREVFEKRYSTERLLSLDVLTLKIEANNIFICTKSKGDPWDKYWKRISRILSQRRIRFKIEKGWLIFE